MKKLTIWQRIIADTPAFFKRVQVFGIGLVTLAASLAEIGVISGRITAIVATAGATLAAISQFAVEQYEPITDNNRIKQGYDKY